MNAELKDHLEREAQRVRPAPAPIGAVLSDGYGRLRRRRVGVVAVAAAAAVLTAFVPATVGWLGDGSSVDRPAGNPSGDVYPYRAGDTVYLDDDVHTSVKGLADRMAKVPSGVVYATGTGAVVLMTEDGRSRQIGDRAGTHQGQMPQRFPEVASDPRTGWVAWMEERDGRDYGEIVVYDTTAGRHGQEVDRRRIGFDGDRNCGDPRSASYGPFAVDGDTVYYCTGRGDFAWRPTGSTTPQRILPVLGDPSTSDDYLLDVRAGLQVVLRYGDGRPRTEVMPVGTTAPETVIRRDLIDGFLSPDGRYLAGLQEEAKNVYDTRTGDRVTPDYLASKAERVPLAMVFTDDGGVAYALIHPSEGDSNIVTCALPAGECETQASEVDGGVYLANQRLQ